MKPKKALTGSAVIVAVLITAHAIKAIFSKERPAREFPNVVKSRRKKEGE